MPGILCSIYNPDNSAIELKWRSGLELVKYYPNHVLEQYSDPGFQLACLYHPAVCQGPRFLVTEHYVLAYYGNIYEDDCAAISEGEPLCHLLLDRFIKHGVDALKHLNGRYNIAVWDRSSRIFHFVSDRFGANRHYALQHQDQGALHLACEVKPLAAFLDQIEIDPAGLASMLTFGHHIGDLTILKGIQCLPNATHLEYHAPHERLTIDCYWHYPYGEMESLPNTEADLAEALHTHLMTALKRQLKGVKNILLPISGGLDSRTLAGLLHQSDFSGEVLAYSYGQPSSRDQRYGRAIARKLGYRHVTIPTPPDFVTHRIDEDSWRFDAEWSSEVHWAVRFSQIEPHPTLGNVTDYQVLSGMFGDIILGSDRFNYRRKAGEVALTTNELRELFFLCNQEYGPVLGTLQLFEPLAAKEAEARLTAIVDQTFRPIANLIPFYALMRAEFEHRQRKQTAMVTQSIEYTRKALTPFLDHDVVEFSMRIPCSAFYNKKLYKQMIRNHLPKVAGIPHDGSGLPLSPSPFRAAIHWRLSRILQLLPQLDQKRITRSMLFNYHASIMRQKPFFEQQSNILHELSPPLNFETALERYRSLLEGRATPADQVCAFLPPALFIRELKRQITLNSDSLSRSN